MDRIGKYIVGQTLTKNIHKTICESIHYNIARLPMKSVLIKIQSLSIKERDESKLGYLSNLTDIFIDCGKLDLFISKISDDGVNHPLAELKENFPYISGIILHTSFSHTITTKIICALLALEKLGWRDKPLIIKPDLRIDLSTIMLQIQLLEASGVNSRQVGYCFHIDYLSTQMSEQQILTLESAIPSEWIKMILLNFSEDLPTKTPDPEAKLDDESDRKWDEFVTHLNLKKKITNKKIICDYLVGFARYRSIPVILETRASYAWDEVDEFIKSFGRE